MSFFYWLCWQNVDSLSLLGVLHNISNSGVPEVFSHFSSVPQQNERFVRFNPQYHLSATHQFSHIKRAV